MNLSELLAYQSRKYPSKEGLVTLDDRITYAQWNQAVNQLAKALQRLGVNQNDKVVIHMSNTKEFVITYFAVQRIRAVAVPINAKFVFEEVSYIFNHCDGKVFLTDDLLFDQVSSLSEIYDGIFIKTKDSADGWLAFDELLQAEESSEVVSDANEEEEASILYTSGTTGKPKGVVFTHKNILAVASMMAVEMEMKPSSRMLHMMPLSHSAPLHLFLIGGTYVGATHVLAPTFSPDLLLELVSKERTTHFFGAPVAYLMTAKHPKVTETDLSWMKSWVYGGAPLSQSEVQFVQDQLDIDHLYCVYGLTEAGPNGTLLMPQEHASKAGSIGQRAALNCEIRLVDSEGQDVKPGEVGEILLKGEGNMKGYYKDEEQTEKAFRNRWLYTGDMAFKDNDGFFWVVDRKKDIIISGGLNIYPRETETNLLEHPHITDVALVGVPHPDWGETVKAFIIQDGTIEDIEAECRQYLHARLADYKIPRLYEEVTELPRNATGKLLKNKLREKARQV
ncbi:class I adenylate-forming enzyme family protein [Halobacillus mangrovi]|uniref:O-succinylbenzoate--CoA ligase n=1 Tax=Halobacillus mangrovi TaxID=402384 RepID=A0A1W5ZTE6_9BACI|nr:long-chain-fatty-acid--CoA ligase [Halobacillus mangrovi]ARI76559.1 o-succinylbenzoate--CoA ligase [Halobacillus mangrovi]